MFKTMLKSALVAATLSLGGLAATTTSASAGNGYIAYHTPGFSIEFGNRKAGYRGHRYRNGHSYRYNRCTPRRAVRKARRNGLRRAHVVRAGRRGVIVAGRQWGDRVVVGFGRHRSCPIRFVRAR